jgi:hypothetical protein
VRDPISFRYGCCMRSTPFSGTRHVTKPSLFFLNVYTMYLHWLVEIYPMVLNLVRSIQVRLG